MDNLNVDWSSGWILSCFFDVKENTQTKAMSQSSVQRNPYCYSWHEANIRGLQDGN